MDVAKTSYKQTPPALEFEHVSFSYPPIETNAPSPTILCDASFAVEQGAFCLLCGATGAGKSTILRLAKPGLQAVGTLTGSIRIMGEPASSFDVARGAQTVGLVIQDPHTQLVCDSVWHELAFGLENVGCEAYEMRRRVAQLSYFLGLEKLFHLPCSEISDGQAQLVALASVLVLEPKILLLDEPTSMLDPLARSDFSHALFRLNRELGITVVLATHEPWAFAQYASCALSIDKGVVRELALSDIKAPQPSLGLAEKQAQAGPELAKLQTGWLRYDRQAPWVLRGVDVSLRAGEIHALLGANGSGKSSLIKAMAGVLKLNKGRHRSGRAPSSRAPSSPAPSALASSGPAPSAVRQAYLPQQPELLLSGLSVAEEIFASSAAPDTDFTYAQSLVKKLGLTQLLDQDPLDLSRGQRQLVAIAKVLALRPQLLFADEPTVGLDLDSRLRVAELLSEHAQAGAAILLATHDMMLAREVAHSCSLLFDGEIACTMPSREFFERNLFFREESL